MSSVNKVILIGHLGRNPEIRFTTSGMQVANFSIATNESRPGRDGGKREEHTEWHRVVAFGKLAQICGEYLTKGKQVFIEGRIQSRSYDDQSGNKRWITEIVANNMVMLGRAAEGPNMRDHSRDRQFPGSSTESTESSPFPSPPPGDDSDVPF